jgi:hypothetical protein
MNGTTSKPLTVTISTALGLTGLGRTKFYELINLGLVKTTSDNRLSNDLW